MVCKVPASSLFPFIKLTLELTSALIGTPIRYRGGIIGTISFINIVENMVYIKLDKNGLRLVESFGGDLNAAILSEKLS